MTFPLISIIGRLASGWLGDRFNKILVTSGLVVIMGIGMLCFSYTNNERILLLIPFVILFGIGWGGNATIRAVLIREYFGRTNFGTLSGFMMGMTALFGMVGPFFVGLIFDNWGSYQGAWLIITGLVIIAFFIMITSPRQQVFIPKAENLK
jgi:MFS family permease